MAWGIGGGGHGPTGVLVCPSGCPSVRHTCPEIKKLMKLRPTLTVDEMRRIIAALIREQDSENTALINRLDLMLYRTRNSGAEKESGNNVAELAAQLDTEYAKCSSVKEAVEKLGKNGVAAILKRKPAEQLTNEEINFIGEYLVENL